jgi:hypothetical protein
MKAWLYPGARVVCVDDYIPRLGRSHSKLKAGVEYTVRWVGHFDNLATGWSGLAVLLEEIKRRSGPENGCEVPYRADRFRPVLPDTTKTVEALKKLVEKTNVLA